MQAIGDQVYALHANVCQTLANPTRLKIINALRDLLPRLEGFRGPAAARRRRRRAD